jgi:hypothetical protein
MTVQCRFINHTWRTWRALSTLVYCILSYITFAIPVTLTIFAILHGRNIVLHAHVNVYGQLHGRGTRPKEM